MDKDRKIEQLERDLERTRKMVDITAFYWGSLTVHKDKWFDEKDVLTVVGMKYYARGKR